MLRRLWHSQSRTTVRLFSTDTMRKVLQAQKESQPEMSFVSRRFSVGLETRGKSVLNISNG